MTVNSVGQGRAYQDSSKYHIARLIWHSHAPSERKISALLKGLAISDLVVK